jgi:hypothetical protein
MALHPFVGPFQLFKCLNPVQNRMDSLDGASARRKASTCIQESTNIIKVHTDIHASGRNGTHDLSVGAGGDSSCLRQRGHCDPQEAIHSML